MKSLSGHLVIFLHGIGGSGASLAPVASSWRSAMTRAAFAAPDAPFPYPGGGHQWFSIDGRELNPGRIATVRAAFDRVANGEIVRAGFEGRHEDVAFVGVSQGAIIALDAVASGRWQVGALVTFAGLLPSIPVAPISVKTDVLLIHGGADPTIPAEETRRAEKPERGRL